MLGPSLSIPGIALRKRAAGGTPTPTPVPLPTLSVAPVFVGGLFNFLPSSYSGPAVQAAQGTGGTPTDIAFRSDQRIDRAAAVALQGGSFLGCSKVYNQLGDGKDLTQATAAQRMQLYLGQGDADVCMQNGRLTGVNVATNGAPRRLLIPAFASINRNAFTKIEIGRQVSSFRSEQSFEMGDLSAIAQFQTVNATNNSQAGYGAKWNNGGSASTTAFTDVRGVAMPMSTLSVNVQRSNGTNLACWRDGYAQSVSGMTGGALTSQAFDQGGQWGFAHDWVPVAAVYEKLGLILYPGILTDSEITASLIPILEQIVGGRNALATNGLFLMGDSIMEGLFAYENRTIGRCLEELMSKNVVARNYGVSGAKASDASIATILSFPSRFKIPSPARNTTVIHIGTNDLSGGATASATFTSLMSLVSASLSRGDNDVVIDTVAPRADSGWLANPSWETERLSLNDMIRNHTGSPPTYTHWDIASHPIVGTALGAANTALYADGLHPTDFAYRNYWAPSLAAVLNGMGIT